MCRLLLFAMILHALTFLGLEGVVDDLDGELYRYSGYHTGACRVLAREGIGIFASASEGVMKLWGSSIGASSFLPRTRCCHHPLVRGCWPILRNRLEGHDREGRLLITSWMVGLSLDLERVLYIIPRWKESWRKKYLQIVG